jgi:hypothetical protein
VSIHTSHAATDRLNSAIPSKPGSRFVLVFLAVSILLAVSVVEIGAQTRRPARPADATGAAAQVRLERGFATGRVTLPDGSPLPPSVENVKIYVNGISRAGQNITYEPIVRANGTYRQALVAGDYRFSTAYVVVRHKDRTYELRLEPVGDLHLKSRSAADGIVQNFVWKATGPTPTAVALGPDPSNHTNWYGMRTTASPGGWRSDYTDTGRLVNPGRAPREIPEGTRITLTLRPLTPALDRRPLTDTTIERPVEWTTRFHDLPPADYELSGFAILPNGTRHTLVFRGSQENRLGFVQSPRVNVEWDQWLRHFFERDHVYYLEGDASTANLPAAAPRDGNARNNQQGQVATRGFVVGELVEILWNGQWFKGRIKAVDGENRWLIGYDGYGTEWDQVVGPDRLRPRR